MASRGKRQWRERTLDERSTVQRLRGLVRWRQPLPRATVATHHMESERLKSLAREYIERVWNRKELDALDELASSDYLRQLGPGQPPIGRAAQKERLRGLLRAMPDTNFEIEDLIAEGDRVVFRVTVRATHLGEMFGLAPTGKALAFTAIDILRFDQGKIVEHWGFGDSASLLRQLGKIA